MTMITRQRHLSSSLLLPLLLLLDYAASSITLSQFQEIQGFSDSCESVWQEAIPGCSKKDFSDNSDKDGTCSRSCLAGVNIINAEVLVACSDAHVDSDTLLGEFLAGYGVAALCGGEETGSETMGASTSMVVNSSSGTDTATATATATTTTTAASLVSTSIHSSLQTTTTSAVQSTATQSAQPSPQSTAAASTTSSESSATSSATSDPNLTITFSGSSSSSTSSTTTTTSTSTSSASSSTSSTNTEAKGFGGVGNAFDILGGESGAGQLERMSLGVVALMAAVTMAIAGGIW